MILTYSAKTMTDEANARRIIAKVLNIEDSQGWTIIDSDPENNLYLVHHRPEANLDVYGHIRGVVVDIDAKVVVSNSYPYTPRTISNEITLNSDGNIALHDEFNNDHVLDMNNIRIKPGCEGTIIHVFKHRGKVYRSTRRKLNPENSHWGGSKYFLDMYWELGGPTDDDLFNSESEYSPYCHMFILVHPDMLVATKINVGEGYIVYLGPRKMWSTDDEPFEYGWVDDTLYLPHTTMDLESESNILELSPMSLADANKHLLFGFYDQVEEYQYIDNRLLPGEFVVIEDLNEDGSVRNMYRVESLSYAWRIGMRDNDPNLLHRFYELTNGSHLPYYTEEDRIKYEASFPLLSSYDHASIVKYYKNNEHLIIWPQIHDEVNLVTKDDRLYNIWRCFLVSVPVHRQKEVVDYIKHFTENRKKVIEWIKFIENANIDTSELKSSRRIQNIISSARRNAKKALKDEQNTNRGKRLSVKQMTRHNIRNFLYKETGGSLYRLVKNMNEWYAEQNEN